MLIFNIYIYKNINIYIYIIMYHIYMLCFLMDISICISQYVIFSHAYIWHFIEINYTLDLDDLLYLLIYFRAASCNQRCLWRNVCASTKYFLPIRLFQIWCLWHKGGVEEIGICWRSGKKGNEHQLSNVGNTFSYHIKCILYYINLYVCLYHVIYI